MDSIVDIRPNSAICSKALLGMSLAVKAFVLICQESFSVSAQLDVDRPESVTAFHRFEAILLMAHAEGRKSVSPKAKVREPDDFDSMGLAVEAFSLIGASTFTVSADLNALKPKTLIRFIKLQEILLMAYGRGQGFAMDKTSWSNDDSQSPGDRAAP